MQNNINELFKVTKRQANTAEYKILYLRLYSPCGPWPLF
jgi:hypothetical protein